MTTDDNEPSASEARGADGEGSDSATRRRPGVSAAARARRIGGARSGGPRRETSAPTEPDNTAADSGGDDANEPADLGEATAEPVALTKSAGGDHEAVRSDAESVDADDPGGDAAVPDEDAGAEAGGEDSDVVPARASVPTWAQWVPAAVLGLFAIAMAVIVIVAAHGIWYAQPSNQATRDRVLAAAKTCIARTNTYHYTSLAKDEASGVKCTTGKYTAQYKKAFDRLIKPQATKLKASQTVQINTAGVQSVARDEWMIIVYGQTKITQSGADPRNDPFAAEVTLRQVHGDWLISLIRLPSQTS